VPEGIIYPQASHVIFAFSSYVLSMEIPSVVLYVSVLFKGLSILGAYFLGRKLGKGVTYSLGLSFVFAFISSWPLNITWGANPFILGFPLFLISLGFLFSMYRSPRKHSLAELFAIGLLFGYIGTIIISYLQTIIVVTSMILVCFLFLERARILRALGEFALIFGVAFIPLSPFFFRFVTFYSYPGHNIGIPQDFSSWTSQQSYISQALQWAFDNLSPHLLLTVMIIVPVISMFILLGVTREYEKLYDNFVCVIRFAFVIFASAMFLSFASFFLPAEFNIVSWGHQGILLSVPISILILGSYIKFAEFVREGKFKPLAKAFPKGSRAALLLIIVVLSLVTSPFLYYRFVADSENLRGTYNIFAVTTKSDYDLMIWIKNNLNTSDAVILVHPFGSGLFIPSVSHNKIVFPYTGSSLSSSYQTLVSLLENNTLNAQTYQIMRYWNISYVFTGTNIADSTQWKPELFLGNPNFKLVKSFGSSALFKLEASDPTVAFSDTFEYSRWNLNGWLNFSYGNGYGEATIRDTSDVSSANKLEITAETLSNHSQYSFWVDKEIFLPSSKSDALLSFYLNASTGFSGIDTLAILISDVEYSQYMVISTPNSIYENHSNATLLNSNEGSFNYNLSEMWRQFFGSSLPQRFVLQLVNYDFDGVPNIAYIDNVTVTSIPVAAP